MIKVGLSSSVKSRLAGYRTHCSEPVEVVFETSFKNFLEARAWETEVLRYYREHVSHGEWIHPNPELDRQIEDGCLLETLSITARKEMLDGYRSLIKGDHRALVGKHPKGWIVSFIGPGEDPMVMTISTWDRAFKLAKWFCRHGVTIKDENPSAFNLLIDGAMEDINEGLDPGEMEVWP